MEVIPDLEKLKDKLQIQNGKIHNLDKQSFWKDEMPNLKRNLTECEEMVPQIIEKIRESPQLSREYVKKLEGRIEFLEQRVTELEKQNYSLQTGQIAFDFEKDLAIYIYPNGKKYGSRKIFTSMKNWLEMKKETPQGREANKKWNDLKKKFSWSEEHEKVFFKLLEFRRVFAHPQVDREAIQTQIPGDFNDEEKKRIRDMLGMNKKVNELMNID
ncbi:uncharacterized protein LOC114537937 [Dendronephthya gigantea]|uniref:uncharacterized protein LOC114537937 n=1 Tax=Dendronephthya gigantea TaxID=151771 RepID=UPI00106AC8A8|nr:uncharacterized protein LOC114537937 [Dendronephthya gigantea]XP_028414854.1 uncharacterized protein LOC114537937 [Dendronephthya gigantea]